MSHTVHFMRNPDSGTWAGSHLKISFSYLLGVCLHPRRWWKLCVLESKTEGHLPQGNVFQHHLPTIPQAPCQPRFYVPQFPSKIKSHFEYVFSAISCCRLENIADSQSVLQPASYKEIHFTLLCPNFSVFSTSMSVSSDHVFLYYQCLL